MELRLLLAFILMGVVLFVTPYLYKTAAPPVKKTAPTAATGGSAPAAPPGVITAPAETAAPAAPETAASETAAPLVAAQQEQTRTIDTDLFKITFSNRGGVVKSWLLKKYKEHSGAPLQLVNTASHADLPAALYFPAQKPAVDLNQALYEVHTDADGLAISFDYSNGKVVAHKSFRFRKSSYLLDVSTEVTHGGKPLPNEIEWRGGFGDMGATNPVGDQQTLYFDVNESKLRKNGAKAAKDGPVTATGNYSFAGIEDKYFVAAFLPEPGATVAKGGSFGVSVPLPASSLSTKTRSRPRSAAMANRLAWSRLIEWAWGPSCRPESTLLPSCWRNDEAALRVRSDWIGKQATLPLP